MPICKSGDLPEGIHGKQFASRPRVTGRVKTEMFLRTPFALAKGHFLLLKTQLSHVLQAFLMHQEADVKTDASFKNPRTGLRTDPDK